MKRTGNALKPLGVLALAVVVLGITGCQSSRDRSLAQQWGDRQVASQVKKELAKDPMYKYPDVQAVVYEGTVQLTGFVDTPEQRQKAAELASHATGVRQIVNTIGLKATPIVLEQFPTNAPVPTAGTASPQRTPATYHVPTKGAGAADQLGK